MTDATKGVFNVDIDPGKYPQARRDDAVVDDFHGTKVRRKIGQKLRKICEKNSKNTATADSFFKQF